MRSSGGRTAAWTRVAVIGLAVGLLPGLADAAALELRSCAVPETAEPMRCGELLVPEDHARPEGRRIKLHVVVVPALERDPERAPLFDLAGGPGIAATNAASFYATLGQAHRRHRDVVLVDQRGTGESSPLRCAELERASSLKRMYPPDAVERCRATLATHADLSKYTTQATVLDLELVRAALGYERVDLFGLSYGTRLALAWIEHAPERIHAAVLTGLVPADAEIPLWHARHAQATLDQVLADCEADAACHAGYPSLRERWKAVLASRRFDGPAREALRTLLAGAEGQRRIPAVIDALGRGDFSAFAKRFATSNSAMFAEGLYLSVMCAEDAPAITEARVREATRDTFLGSYRADEQLGACKVWNVPASTLRYGRRKHDVPVLMVAGDRDYVTPVAWAERAIAAFPRGRLVVIPKLGHTPDGLANAECFDDVMGRFLARPDAAALDLSCVAGMTPPAFEVRAAAAPD